jgi:hypothetical protein
MTVSNLDLLLDLAKSDINHPEKKLTVQRYICGEDFGGGFKQGETIYEVGVGLWGPDGSGNTPIAGWGRTFDEALADAVCRMEPWLKERIERARGDAERAAKEVSAWESLLPK